MLRPTRRLAALVAVLTSGTAALVAPVSAGASPELAVTAAPSVPTDEAGHGKVILAFQYGVAPAGTFSALRDLGVEHAIELPTIGAVAVSADLAVVDLLSTLPGVVTVEPQRRLVSHLYASKEQLNAIGVDQPATYTTRVGGKRVTGTRPSVTGAGATVAVLDSGIFAGHPDFGDRVVKGLNFSYAEGRPAGRLLGCSMDAYAESTGALALQDEIGHGTHVASTVVGFTSLSEARDQEEVREIVSTYFEECSQIISRYGGTVEKFIGDAVMAVWGVPTAHGDDAERAVRAGLELVNRIEALGVDLQVPDLAMRVGIVTGEVAVTIGAEQQGMVAGDAVNTASRVQSAATPGQVWVDETTRLLTTSAISYVYVGSHAMKGKADPVPLWSVRAVVAAIGGAQRADGLEAPLMGRDRELRLVKELSHGAEETHLPPACRGR